jgi:hypothetical protein
MTFMADGGNDKYRFKTFVGFPILHSLSGGIYELPIQAALNAEACSLRIVPLKLLRQ